MAPPDVYYPMAYRQLGTYIYMLRGSIRKFFDRVKEDLEGLEGIPVG